MRSISRRHLLAVGGTGLGIGGAGCLADKSGSDGTATDSGGDAEESADGENTSGLTAPARWVPTAVESTMFFTYTDLETVRAREDALRAETIDEISFQPHGAGGRVVGRLETAPSFEFVLEFGPEGTGGYHVLRGEFDLAGLDVGEPVDEIGEFEVFEAANASVAASSDTLIVVDSDVGGVDDVLAAGIDGTGRRAEEDDAFATVLEHVGDDTLSVGVVPGSADGDGTALGRSWAVESETTRYTQVMIGDSVSELDEDELKAQLVDESVTGELENTAVDIDGTTAVGTGTVPTSEFRYQDRFRKLIVGISRPVRVDVSLETATATQSVTVTLISIRSDGHVEVRDGDGTRATLTEDGDDVTLEYGVGESVTVSVVGVNDDEEKVIATKSIEF